MRKLHTKYSTIKELGKVTGYRNNKLKLSSILNICNNRDSIKVILKIIRASEKSHVTISY